MRVIEKYDSWLRLKLMPKPGEMMRIGRTVEGTVFELVFLLLSIVALVLVVWVYLHSAEQIPSAAQVMGIDENHTSARWTLLVDSLVIWLVSAAYLLGAYFPKSGDMGRMMTKATGEKAILLVSRWRRIDAVLGTLFLIAMTVGRGHEALGIGLPPMALILVPLILIVVVWIVFFVRSVKGTKELLTRIMKEFPFF